jgi:transcriptional regulator of acetoin/glycerol metabolism
VPPKVRLIATASGLAERVRSGTFRQDLWDRISHVTLTLPLEIQTAEGLLKAIDTLEQWIEGNLDTTPGKTPSHEWREFVRAIRGVMDRGVIAA